MSPSKTAPTRTRPSALKVLHVAPTFFPATAFGGPIVSTHALCNALVRAGGIELKVLTTNAAGYSRTQRIETREMPHLMPAGYEVFYMPRIAATSISPALLMRLWKMIRWADVVHLNAVYSFPTLPTVFACRMLKTPLVWSPRGAWLAAETWTNVRRPALKSVWDRAALAACPADCLLHVTSDEEQRASEARTGLPSVVIANGVDIPELDCTRSWRPDGRIRAMYLGRIDPIKALENVIDAVAMSPPASLSLDIYGSGDTAYVAELQSRAKQSGVADRVHFRGHVDGIEKRHAFATADALILASHSENFGMVVAEALAHGVPALVSRNAPWDRLEDNGCGLWIDNTSAAIAGAFDTISRRDLAAMGAAGRAWTQRAFNWGAVANEMRRTYTALAKQQSHDKSMI